MKGKAIFHSVLVVVLCVGLLFNGACADTGATGVEKPSKARPTVYERVAATKTLRAAYITYPPAVIRDPATGKLTGTFVETLERAADNLGWKVQWTEEV